MDSGYYNKINSDKNKILIVDDQIFNVNALNIILQYSIGIEVDEICENASSGDTLQGSLRTLQGYQGKRPYIK